MSEKNPHLDNQLIAYPSLRNYKIIIGYAAIRNQKKTETLREVIRFFIDQKLTPSDQEMLMKTFDKLTPDQKRNPKRYLDSK